MEIEIEEEIVRVPLLIRAPIASQPGCVDDHLISMNLDLLPKLCDYAGVAQPRHLLGRSLRTLVESRAPDEWRDAVFIETEFCTATSLDITGHAVRTARHKYIVYSHGERREQLFDLEQDPGETRNLAGSATHAENPARPSPPPGRVA